MASAWHIPRNALAWILLSQAVLIVPHIARLPAWVLGTYVVCALWRIMVFQGRWSLPPKIVKVLLSLACFVGIYQSYGSLMGMEPTVALLFSGFSLKLLELGSRRDVYVVIFLAYFVALTEFLFNQDFAMVVLVFATVMLVTTALVALHQQDYQRFDWISLRKTAVLFAQAVPLMVVLFIIFPRFEPLWQVPMPSHQATTGIGESLAPGDISELAQSGELAFRAQFEQLPPAREKLYWRGLVLSQFDGRAWRQGKLYKNFLTEPARRDLKTSLQDPLRYSLVQEPSYQPWLFTLALAHSDDTQVLAVDDYRLVRDGNIHSRIKVEVISDLNAPIEPLLAAKIRRRETLLPSRGNPQSRAYANQLYRESADDRAFVNAVMMAYFQQEFVYTLKPPLLGEHSIDDFLFNTRRGFCGHYASSFTFLMRAVGIPARVVTGYQGGEINPVNGTVLVHQFDAHAWAEVWLAGSGWVRFDPTGMVSPLRIEQGLERALAQEGSFLEDSPLSPMHFRNIAWLNNMRLQMDAYSYYWSSWVLQYKGQRQLDVMTALLGEINAFRVSLFVVGIGALIMAVVALFALAGRGRPRLPAETRLYLALCRRTAAAGYPRQQQEGAVAYAQRIGSCGVAWGPPLLPASQVYNRLQYEPLSGEQRSVLLKQLRRQLLKIGLQLEFSRRSSSSGHAKS